MLLPRRNSKLRLQTLHHLNIFFGRVSEGTGLSHGKILLQNKAALRKTGHDCSRKSNIGPNTPPHHYFHNRRSPEHRNIIPRNERARGEERDRVCVCLCRKLCASDQWSLQGQVPRGLRGEGCAFMHVKPHDRSTRFVACRTRDIPDFRSMYEHSEKLKLV